MAIDDDIASRRFRGPVGGNFDFSKLSSDGVGGPNPIREAALNVVLEQSKKSVFQRTGRGGRGLSTKRGSHAPGQV